MWGKLILLLWRRPDLLLGHAEAYTRQAAREWRSHKRHYVLCAAGLLVSSFFLVLALTLLLMAGMLDLALNITHRAWVYGLPAAALLCACVLLYYFQAKLKQGRPSSELKRQIQADWQALRALAPKE